MFFLIFLTISGFFFLLEILYKVLHPLITLTKTSKACPQGMVMYKFHKKDMHSGYLYCVIHGYPVYVLQIPGGTCFLLVPERLLGANREKLQACGPFSTEIGPLHTLRRYWCRLTDPVRCECTTRWPPPCFPRDGTVLTLTQEDSLPRVFNLNRWLLKHRPKSRLIIIESRDEGPNKRNDPNYRKDSAQAEDSNFNSKEELNKNEAARQGNESGWDSKYEYLSGFEIKRAGGDQNLNINNFSIILCKWLNIDFIAYINQQLK